MDTGSSTAGIVITDGPSAAIVPPASVPAYRPALPATWWLRNRRYMLFVLRELTAVPITLWLISLLAEIARLRGGQAGYYAYVSPRYVIFSLLCLAFALLHSITWLTISGLILRVPLGERDLDPRIVTAANFALWIVATIVIGALLVLFGAPASA